MSNEPGSRQRLLRGAKFDVERVTVAAHDGSTRERELVVHPGSVVILPMLDDERLVLIRNHRYAVGRELWELPAGTLEPGEDPAPCAARELEEETGYRAAHIEALMQFLPVPGWCTERMFAYVARGLTPVGQKLEATEQIVAETRAFDEAITMVRDGVIEDAKTIAVLLYYERFARA
ncbi:MAG: NUDIX hydrolase [Myxococcales bacterium]|nr:NUDIX hydrolase [Myxococcales bacterium]